MSGLLKRLNVLPLYGQVVIECEDASDLPMPETGTERVVATAQSILVATRGDQDGDVTIEVYAGTAAPTVGELVFDGELNCPTPKLVVGSSLANALAAVDLGQAGWVPVKVYVAPAEAPSRVTVMVPA
jgi:hypothetical protein